MENDNEKTVRQNRIIPFVLALPKDGDRYFELLNTSQSITMRSGLVVLQEGENVGSHNTGQHEEILIILNGCGEVETDGFGKYKIEKSCVAYIPPNTQHNVANLGNQELRYIYIVAKV